LTFSLYTSLALNMKMNSVTTRAEGGVNGFLRHVFLRLTAVLIWTCSGAQLLAQHQIDGHVFRSESQIPLQDVIVVAWPCGQTTVTNSTGYFRVGCPIEIDSITYSASFFETSTVPTLGTDHLDVWLDLLQVNLDAITIEALHSPEAEAQRIAGPDLLQALDQTPGLQSLDLGAALVQPVIRGLVGSRVAVLEDGVPQKGGRWGNDHGILADPLLYGAMEWIPGGGHLWLGPESVGGGIRFTAPRPIQKNQSRTSWGASFRQGDQQLKTHALHVAAKPDRFWHVGVSSSAFGNQNIPQASFTYLARLYELKDKALPNTSGRAVHGTAGLERQSQKGGRVEYTLRVSDVLQGLFPGIVGIPRERDLQVQTQPFSVDIPQQQATRIQTLATWKTDAEPSESSRTVKASITWNRRLESAPPHAHGWGPEPTSTLSLSLEEWNGFLESTWRGVHGTWAMQLEGLAVNTSGWEFLLPSHKRLRWSILGEKRIGIHQLGLRADFVGTEQAGHQEPLYNSDGSVAGVDQRTAFMQRLIPGGMASWIVHLDPASNDWKGTASLVIYTRAPSNYELGANGIHHGTFRFEQGNSSLRSEKSMEARFQAHSRTNQNHWSWRVQAFSALHRDFISLSPSAQFAPISHAGLVYLFDPVNAFRTGLEASTSIAIGNWTTSMSGSILGQWNIATGLGLPFTTPAQIQTTIEREIGKSHRVSISSRSIAAANLTARNENPTEGALLWEIGWNAAQKIGTWSLKIHNLFNTAWLDHTSAYRALGLAAQGRWIQISFVTTIKH
jgi:iron complex outermembrane receptor protein